MIAEPADAVQDEPPAVFGPPQQERVETGQGRKQHKAQQRPVHQARAHQRAHHSDSSTLPVVRRPLDVAVRLGGFGQREDLIDAHVQFARGIPAEEIARPPQQFVAASMYAPRLGRVR